jgi:hypothetical protein
MNIRVADQAWIALASLHREHPDRNDFGLQEIVGRARQEFATSQELQPGVWQHIVSHGVAQNKPSPARLRLFTKTDRSRRRLFRPDDTVNPKRTGRTHPEPSSLPEKYRPLVDWYLREYVPNGKPGTPTATAASSSPSAFLAFVGLIPAYDLGVMQRSIEQECERIEHE